MTSPSPPLIHTNGGAVVNGSVTVNDGDFVGRDQIIEHIDNFFQQATSAVEEAEKALSLADQRLAEGVRNYADRLRTLFTRLPDDDVGAVYKGLLAYRLDDAEIFCGRDAAIKEVRDKLANGPLTILHAQSGAGKSSLLQAGIAPRLLQNSALPIYVRAYDVPPALAIKRIFLPNLGVTPAWEGAPLRDFLRQVTSVLKVETRLYLLLDQFEEFFTLVNPTEQRAFVRELADCLEDPTLNVRWLLALRSEFFSDMASFGAEIENPFANEYRLNCLTLSEAQRVIIVPALRQGIDYEPALVDRVLQELGDEKGEVAPPQLQLICRALYSR
ncbi:MAG: hypothetical protein M3Q45_04130, partial [Chloroflexota bacterium]|nr:hypothetical protein [Chloroflexota bacterium]